MVKGICLTCIAACALFFCWGQKRKTLKPQLYDLHFSFHNKVGNADMSRDTTFTNNYNEPFKINRFKYYISNISLVAASGKETKIPDTYYLLDEEIADSKKFTIKSPTAQVTAIRFYLGVDSLRNVSGVQTGALDPMNGMFWTWSTGYIMAKFEGVSPVSKAPQQRLSFHIGGFKTGQNVSKQISIALPRTIDFATTKNATVSIAADLNKWFTGTTEIHFTDTNFCMNPGDLANSIAANYANMFTLIDVKTD